jgi:hypothetical protein
MGCVYCSQNKRARRQGKPEPYPLRDDGEHEATDDDGLCLARCFYKPVERQRKDSSDAE